MAVDSRNKRASAIRVSRPWAGPGPNPDGSLASAADRQHMAYAYAGIDAGSAPPAAEEVVFEPGFLLSIGRFMS